jgi:hypothetical protein
MSKILFVLSLLCGVLLADTDPHSGSPLCPVQKGNPCSGKKHNEKCGMGTCRFITQSSSTSGCECHNDQDIRSGVDEGTGTHKSIGNSED